jgi:hypothetical protein
MRAFCTRALALVALALTGFACSSESSDAAPGHSASSIGILNEIERSGSVGANQLEYYVGGGQPPPYYRSDQFRAYRLGSQEILELSQVVWDQRYTPSELHRIYRLPAQPGEIREIVRLIIDARVFENVYPEETDRGVADVLRHEILVVAPGLTHQRTYYQTVPTALVPLRDRIQQHIARLTREGALSYTHQGNPIQYQPAL